MKSFLKEVAEALIKDVSNFRELEIIVPNRRTGVFLKKYISECVSKTVWMPKITTIKDIFSANSKLSEAEDVILIYKLYNCFVKHTSTSESFDDFYYWGEIILADFDNIDKYLVDAEKLFSTIVDLKEIDSKFDGYEEDAIEIIKRFWHNVNQAKISSHKEAFLELWMAMYQIYSDYKKELSEKNIAYQGMIYKDVVDNINIGKFNKETYAIVGFNALNKCEKALLHLLKANKSTLFFWDADKYYLDDKYQEAGRFIRENIRVFGAYNNIGIVNNIVNNQCNIDVIMAPSPVSQTKMIAEILNKWVAEEDYIPEKTAIILGDENLLLPLMYSVPNSLEPYNVSMGFPIKNSMTSDFITHLIDLQKRVRGPESSSFYFKDILAILKHSFINIIFPSESKTLQNKLLQDKLIYIESDVLQVNDLFKLIFSSCQSDVRLISNYLIEVVSEMQLQISKVDEFYMDVEFLNKVSIRLNALNTCLIDDNITFNKPEIFFKLISDFIRSASVAFEGEPLEGMQVLGFLETRSLDFDRVIMLSINEGVFPKKSTAQSLIPYNLRKFHELPSIEYQDSIFAYYFYRIFQKVKDVKIIYSSQGGDTSSEASRFISQIKYEFKQKINYHNDGYKVLIDTKIPTYAKKNDANIQKIKDHFNKGFSPKAINTYLNCKFQYYLEYIKKIKEPDKLEEEQDGAFFGRLFHEIMKHLYTPYVGKVINIDDFKNIDDSKIENALSLAIKDVFKSSSDKETEKLKDKIIVDIVRRYVLQMLNYDKKSAPFTILSLEESHQYRFALDSGIEVNLKGFIDRVDLVDGIYRILDYKTGKTDLKVKKTLETLFDESRKYDCNTATQILTYSLIYKRNNKGSKVCPGVININKISDKLDYQLVIDKSTMNSFDDENEELFVSELNTLFANMLDVNTDFMQTENTDNCTYCIYKTICDK